MPGKLKTIDQAVSCSEQHTKPCSDCPWARKAARGWLGGLTAEQWLAEAHGESRIDCHTLLGPQCAGAAIYRANVGKLPRDRTLLRLPADLENVFAGHKGFREHHDIAAIAEEIKGER